LSFFHILFFKKVNAPSVTNGHTIDSDEINLDNVELETSMAKWELNLDMWTMCIYLFKKKDMEETQNWILNTNLWYSWTFFSSEC
jgi:hypothetical protein